MSLHLWRSVTNTAVHTVQVPIRLEDDSFSTHAVSYFTLFLHMKNWHISLTPATLSEGNFIKPEAMQGYNCIPHNRFKKGMN
jgi:hypothetical protein